MLSDNTGALDTFHQISLKEEIQDEQRRQDQDTGGVSNSRRE
jgi:hypothetical protein